MHCLGPAAICKKRHARCDSPVVLAADGILGAVVGVAGVRMMSHDSKARLKWLSRRVRMRCRTDGNHHSNRQYRQYRQYQMTAEAGR